AGTSDVPQQELQDAGTADGLDAARVLRPADCVTDRAGLLAARSAGEDVRDLEELLARNAAVALHHLRRVAREMALQHLEDAARVLQRLIANRLVDVLRFAAAVLAMPAAGLGNVLALRALVEPGVSVVLPAIESAEESAEIFGVLEVLSQDRRRVRIANDILAELALVGQHVVDHRAEEDDVAAGAKREPVVRHRGRAVEARIDVNDLRAVLLARFDHPLKRD